MDFDQAFVKTHSIDLKGIIIQMHSSVVRCFAFHVVSMGAAIFHRHRIQIKRQNKHKHGICLPFNKIGEVLSFSFCSKSVKT